MFYSILFVCFFLSLVFWAVLPARRRPRPSLFFSIALVAGIVLAFTVSFPEIYVSPHFLLPRDNAGIGLASFVYFAEWLKYFHSVPNWLFAGGGGVWIEPLANNYNFLLPYRWLGAGLAAVTSGNLILLYKISFLWIGEGIFFVGIALLAYRLLGSFLWAMILVAGALLSPVYVGVLHQEHVLATVFYLPYLWLCALGLSERPRNIIFMGALAGLSMNQSYPHHLVIYSTLLFAAALLTSKKTLSTLVHWARFYLFGEGRAYLFFAGLSFIVAASSVLYSYLFYLDRLGAPDRFGGEAVISKGFEQYAQLNRMHFTSLFPANLKLLFWKGLPKEIGPLDDVLLFSSGLFPLVLFLGGVVRFPAKKFQWAVLFLLILASIGIYGPLPRFFWTMLPGMGIFRQWVHFLDFFNVHLVFFTGFVLKSLVDKAFTSKRREARALVVFLGLALFWSQAEWSLTQLERYESTLIPSHRIAFSDDAKSYGTGLLGLGPSGKFLGKVLVNPKLASESLKQGEGTLQWLMRKGETRPVSLGSVTAVATFEGLRVHREDVPGEATALVLPQFDDGRWRLALGEGTVSSYQTKISIPVNSGAPDFTLTRTNGMWHSLIWMMWVPLLICSLYFWAVPYAKGLFELVSDEITDLREVQT
jgi:hypothetical protein